MHMDPFLDALTLRFVSSCFRFPEVAAAFWHFLQVAVFFCFHRFRCDLENCSRLLEVLQRTHIGISIGLPVVKFIAPSHGVCECPQESCGIEVGVLNPHHGSKTKKNIVFLFRTRTHYVRNIGVFCAFNGISLLILTVCASAILSLVILDNLNGICLLIFSPNPSPNSNMIFHFKKSAS